MLGFAVSLLAPGIGHGVVGHARRGAAWVLAFVGLWLLSAILTVFWLPAILWGLGLTVLLYLACAVDAARVPRRAIGKDGWVLLFAAFGASMLAPVPIALALRVLVVEAFKIPSGGMCPTFAEGDHVFVDKRAYSRSPPARGDVVVHEHDGAMFVKRVVAVAGDRVRVQDGRVSIDGQPVPLRALGRPVCEDQELHEETLGSGHSVALGAGPPLEPIELTVPEGHLYLLGDNRNNSFDSRQQGPIATTTVSGRASVIWLSGERAVWRTVK